MGKPGNTGLSRIVSAADYSIKGLKAAWINEAAFRQECVLGMILLPCAFWLGEGTLERILLVSSVLLVLVIELLNSAVEAVVDLVTKEHTELAGRAKDMGSAAVMVSLVLVFIVWSGVACDRFLF